MKYFLFIGVLNLLVLPARADVLELSDWEDGIPDVWTVSTSTKNDVPVVTSSQACSGDKSLMFNLDYRSDGKGYRNELSFGGPYRKFDYGTDYWVSWAIFLPADYGVDKHSEILFQMHGYPDQDSSGKLIEPWRNPIMALYTGGEGNWAFSIRGDSNKITTPKKYTRYKSFSLGDFLGDRGKWTEFVMRVTFDYGSGGRTELWKNGEKLVDDYGQNAFNDDHPPYLKIGIYKPSWKPVEWGGLDNVASRKIFYDRVRVARNSSFAAAVPNCGEGPRPPVIFDPAG